MNVYDFDDTIYDGDTTVGFILYTATHHPLAMVRALPTQVAALASYALGKCSKTQMKSRAFVFLRYLKDVDADVKNYWEKHRHQIKGWYLRQQRGDDVVISASAEFLLEGICKDLGIYHLIATKMDKHTGIIEGENCKGSEKVNRFYEVFPQGRVDEFYSDHDSDRFMARLAEKSYLVKKNELVDWMSKGQTGNEADTKA